MRAAANTLFGKGADSPELFWPYFQDDENKAEKYQELMQKQSDPEFKAKIAENIKRAKEAYAAALKAKQDKADGR